MDGYKWEITSRVLCGMGIVPEEVENMAIQLLDERIELIAAEKLSFNELLAFCFLFHCYNPEKAVAELKKTPHREIKASSLKRNADRAKGKLRKLTLNDPLIKSWSKEWRKSKESPRKS